MAVAIRLSRGGAKKRPYYRIVVADSRSGRDGKYLEQIGTYNPLLAKDDENRVKIDGDRAKHWLSVGAQPSDRVARFLDAAGVRERAARSNPKKGEPGENAKTRAEERAEKEKAAAEAAAEAAAAPAPEPEAAEPEAAVEEAPAAEAEAAPAEAENDATGSVKSEETAEAVAEAVEDFDSRRRDRRRCRRDGGGNQRRRTCQRTGRRYGYRGSHRRQGRRLSPMDKPVTLAAVAGAHGVTGDVRLKLFGEGVDALLAYKSFNEGALTLKKLHDDGKGGAIARFAEVADRTAAENLRGTALTVPRSAMPPLGEGEYYHADLLGLPAESATGEALGTIVAVANFGAGDILEIEKPDGKRAMVPMNSDAVPEWNAERAVIDPAFLA